jgi:hypothetical protein
LFDDEGASELSSTRKTSLNIILAPEPIEEEISSYHAEPLLHFAPPILCKVIEYRRRRYCVFTIAKAPVVSNSFESLRVDEGDRASP